MNLSEAFKRLDTLNEDIFSTSGSDAFERMKDFRDESLDTEDNVDIIDLEAETEEDLKDSYVGKVIIDCQVCHSKIFKDADDIEIDKENEVVNKTEECPYCHSVDGYKLLGKIADFQPKEEEEEEDSEEEINLDTEIEDTQEDELDFDDLELGESLKEAKFDSLDNLVDTELGLCKEDLNESFLYEDVVKDTKCIEKAYPAKKLYITCIDKKSGEEQSYILEPTDSVECRIPKEKTKSTWNYSKKENSDEEVFANDLSINSGITDEDYKWYYRFNVIIDNGPDERPDDYVYEDGDSDNVDDFKTESLKEGVNSNFSMEKIAKDAADAIKVAFEKKLAKGDFPADTKLNAEAKKVNNQGSRVNVRLELPLDVSTGIYNESKKEYLKIIANLATDTINFDNISFKVQGSKPYGWDDTTTTQNITYIVSSLDDTDGDKTYVWVGKSKKGALVTKSSIGQAKAGTLNGLILDTRKLKSGDCFVTKQECEQALKAAGLEKQFSPFRVEVDLNSTKGSTKITRKENLEESIDSVNINATDKSVDVTADDNGAIDIHIENAGAMNSFDNEFETPDMSAPAEGEYLAPVDDELLGEIKDEPAMPQVDQAGAPAVDDMSMDADMGEMPELEAGAEDLAPEEPAGEEVDVDLDDFDEESFDDLGESYLREVYENVDSFKTTGVQSTNNRLFIEGLIKFNSGKTKSTNFIFEAKDITRSGKARFVGENCQICRGKKAFTVTGTLKNGKFLSESLNYNYRAKNPSGKSSRLYGTVKLSESYKNKK